MRLFERSALPVERSQAVVGRLLAVALLATLIAPWWARDGETATGLELVRMAPVAAWRSTTAMAGNGGAEGTLAVARVVHYRRVALAPGVVLAGGALALLASRRRWPRLAFAGATLEVAGPLSTIVEETVLRLAAEFGSARTVEEMAVALLWASGAGAVSLVAAAAAVLGLLEWRAWAFWTGTVVAFLGALTATVDLGGSAWGVRLAAIVAGVAFAWESRPWDELATAADDPELAGRRAALLEGRAWRP